MMWFVAALLSAIFAGSSNVLAKAGVQKTDSDVATFIRTCIVLIFSWIVVLVSHAKLAVPPSAWFFLLLSGCATGVSWLCFFKALQLKEVSSVLPVDKLNVILTVFLGLIFFGERFSELTWFGLICILGGTFCMIEPTEKSSQQSSSLTWLVYALLSGVFASLTVLFGKLGLKDVDANLASAIRTCVVLIFTFGVLCARKKLSLLFCVPHAERAFLVTSGVATGLSWLCYFNALQAGPMSVVGPLDKLSTPCTVVLAAIFLHERITYKSAFGLVLLIAGTLLLM